MRPVLHIQIANMTARTVQCPAMQAVVGFLTDLAALLFPVHTKSCPAAELYCWREHTLSCRPNKRPKQGISRALQSERQAWMDRLTADAAQEVLHILSMRHKTYKNSCCTCALPASTAPTPWCHRLCCSMHAALAAHPKCHPVLCMSLGLCAYP